MEIFEITLSFFNHLPGKFFTNSSWLDNDPGLYVCGIPIALIGYGIYYRVIKASEKK